MLVIVLSLHLCFRFLHFDCLLNSHFLHPLLFLNLELNVVLHFNFLLLVLYYHFHRYCCFLLHLECHIHCYLLLQIHVLCCSLLLKIHSNCFFFIFYRISVSICEFNVLFITFYLFFYSINDCLVKR